MWIQSIEAAKERQAELRHDAEQAGLVRAARSPRSRLPWLFHRLPVAPRPQRAGVWTAQLRIIGLRPRS